MKSFLKKFSPNKQKNEPIIVISGLPRCGTSMMMQMIEAGGIEIVTDHIRRADEDNPRGYYEFEKVKEIKNSTDWLEECHGKAFKMVSALLYYLPKDKNYKVLFMKRKMQEMLASQKTMLERQGIKDDSVSDEKMAEKYEKHLQKMENYLKRQSNIDVIFINYNEVTQDPHNNAKLVSRFLGDRLNVDKMVDVVDKSLYRQRDKNV